MVGHGTILILAHKFLRKSLRPAFGSLLLLSPTYSLRQFEFRLRYLRPCVPIFLKRPKIYLALYREWQVVLPYQQK